ncbi:hypothetical protein [Nocardia sp. NPDC046763]|uniref:DUF7257 domain-containing protein n=1 Tax=Nocardia sp. NPDC046763 TaxID=3155256 RepID=UPI00340912E9
MPTPEFVSGAGSTLRDLGLGHVLEAVTGVPMDALGSDIAPAAGLQAWSANLENQTATANAGVATVSDVATANSAAIAHLTATTTSTGATVSDQFASAGALSGYSNWNLGGSSLGAGVQLSVNPAGSCGIGGSPTGTSTGALYALSTTAMTTDNHTVTLVCAATGNIAAYTSAILRAAPDMSSFVYLNVFQNVAQLGRGSFTGGAWTFTLWKFATLSQAQAQTIAVKASGTTYTVSVGGAELMTYTDSAGTAATGTGHRSVGFAVQAEWSFAYSYGWPLASFTAVDS